MSQPPKPVIALLHPTEIRELTARLDQDVDRSGGPDACWPWTGGIIVQGYGAFHLRAGGKRRLVKAHRTVFELSTGQCPPTVDHRCHDLDCLTPGPDCPHRRCCNPTHLEAATNAANASRAKAGAYRDLCGARLHKMTPENTYISPDAQNRRCRACAATQARDARAQARLARSPGQAARGYRPRGMSREQLVGWALGDQDRGACCFWPGSQSPGYPKVTVERRTVDAHRLVFEVLNGPVSPGMVVDHICHVPGECEGGPLCPHRPCINPDHLAAVPSAVNTSVARAARRRRDRCKRGHLFTLDNTYTDRRGSRHCLACQAKRARERSAKPPKPPRERCKNGHLLTSDTIWAGPTGNGRQCVLCRQSRRARYETKKRASAPPT